MSAESHEEPPVDEPVTGALPAFGEASPHDPLVAEVPCVAEVVADRPSLPHPHLGWALLWVLMFWGMQFLAGVPVAMIVVASAVSSGQRSPEELNRRLEDATVWMVPVGTFVTVLWAVAVAALFYRRAFGQRLALRGMPLQHWAITLLLVLPLAVLASEVTNYAADARQWILDRLPGLSQVLSEFNMEVLSEFAALPWPVVLLAACLFPAVGEEIYCRGFLGRGLVAHHGVWWGVLLSSLLFGVMHVEPVQALGAFALGVGLHYVYLTVRSLLAPIVIHLLNNAFAFWAFRSFESYPIPGVTPLPDGSQVHTPPALLASSGLAATGLCYLLYATRTRWLLPDQTEWTPGYVTAEEPPASLSALAISDRPPRGASLLCVAAYAGMLWSMWAAYRAAVS